MLLGACRPGPPIWRDVVVDYSNDWVELVRGREVTQVFRPNHDDVGAVAVVVSNAGGMARDCEVVLRLRAKDSTVDLAERRIECAFLPAEDWVRLDFAPLAGSARERIVISVHSPDGRPGEAPRLAFANLPGIYPDAKLRFNETEVPGALRFVSYHH